MYSRVLDSRTYADVVAYAPRLRSDPEVTARQVLRFILKASEFGSPIVREEYLEGVSNWSAIVGHIANELPDRTPHEIGRACADLGLASIRTRDGYRVFWNQQQLDILRRALGVSDD
jgi:hypothetical protein